MNTSPSTPSGNEGNSGADSSFTRYLSLRDNSDLKNGVNPFASQFETENFRVEAPSGYTATEPEFLSDWSPRDKPWDKHRAYADQIAEMYGTCPEFQNLARRVSECSLSLGFAWAPDWQDPTVDTLKLRQAHFCPVRHCPI